MILSVRPLALVALVAVAGCTSEETPSPTLGPSQGPQGSFADWAQLETPLRLPGLAVPATCPTTAGHTVDPATGPGLGPGPVYPVGLGTGGVLAVVQSGATWRQKVLWVASPDYEGPVLIRGGRLGGSGRVEFALGLDVAATPELQLTATGADSQGGPGWREWPSYTIVPGPGCYAYQVDGVGFTTVIVFSVTT